MRRLVLCFALLVFVCFSQCNAAGGKEGKSPSGSVAGPSTSKVSLTANPSQSTSNPGIDVSLYDYINGYIQFDTLEKHKLVGDCKHLPGWIKVETDCLKQFSSSETRQCFGGFVRLILPEQERVKDRKKDKPFTEKFVGKLTPPDPDTNYSTKVYFASIVWKRSIFGPKLPRKDVTACFVRFASTEEQHTNAEETLLKQLEKIDSDICAKNQPESYWDILKKEKQAKKDEAERKKLQTKAEKEAKRAKK